MIEVIAGVACAFYCADKAYHWFREESDRKIKLAFTERRLAAEEKAAQGVVSANEPMAGMAKAHDRLARNFPAFKQEDK